MLSGVLLAAGQSLRLGQPKQLLQQDGLALVQRAVRAMNAVCDEVIVVTGAHAALVTATLEDERCRCVHAEGWSQGMAASLTAGVNAAGGDAVLVSVVDQPGVTPDQLVKLFNVWQNAPSQPVAAAYGDTVGVPAIVPLAGLREALPLSGDRGLRDWLRTRSGVLTVDMPEAAADIDTPDDWQRWTTQQRNV